MKPFDIEQIEKIIGYTFIDKRNLVEAFTHSSYANENADLSYERLEFLGDSILGFVVANYLFKQYPEEDEGFLTQTKAKIVSGKALSSVMSQMGLIHFVRTAQGSIENEILNSGNVMEDLFEAIIGAIMVDSNDYKECEKFIFRHLGKSLSVNYLEKITLDYKSKLLEYIAKNKGMEIKFVVTPLADNVNSGFKAQIKINDQIYGIGEGVSKKKAEQQASKKTLDMLRIK